MSVENKTKLHPNVRAAGWVSLFTDFSSEMIIPLLPVFLKTVLRSSIAFIGLIEGAAETTASLLKLWSGRRSDKMRNRKRLVLLGYSLSSFSRPLMAVAGAAWHVLAFRMTDRVGKGIRTSPRDALIADVTPPEQRGAAFGFQRAMDNAGAFIGPLVAAAILWALHNRLNIPHDKSLRILFGIAAIPGILAVLVILFFIREPEATHEKKPVAPLTLHGFSRDYWKYLAAVIVFTLGNSSDAFLLLRANSLGVPEWQLPLLWAAFHAVKTAFSTAGGKLSDKVGRRPLLLLGWTIYALCYAAFGLASAAWQIWAIFLVYGLYYACTEGVERAVVADFARPDQRGSAFGIFHAAVGIAALPASLLFGALWEIFHSPLIPFLAGAILAATGAILLNLVRWPAKK